MALTEPRPVEATPTTLRAMYERTMLIRRSRRRRAGSSPTARSRDSCTCTRARRRSASASAPISPTSDMITSTHRGHGHCIAKGCDLRAMFAEIAGREHRALQGQGGSMHVADFSKGMLGANAIVGGGIRSPTEPRWRRSVHAAGRWRCASSATAPPTRASLHESMNLASIWKPAGRVRLREQRLGRVDAVRAIALGASNVAGRAAGYGMAGAIVDGRDVSRSSPSPGEAIARARRGDGPTLIEAKTHRFFGHYVGDRRQVPQRGELAAFRAARPDHELRARTSRTRGVLRRAMSSRRSSPASSSDRGGGRLCARAAVSRRGDVARLPRSS